MCFSLFFSFSGSFLSIVLSLSFLVSPPFTFLWPGQPSVLAHQVLRAALFPRPRQVRKAGDLPEASAHEPGQTARARAGLAEVQSPLRVAGRVPSQRSLCHGLRLSPQGVAQELDQHIGMGTAFTYLNLFRFLIINFSLFLIFAASSIEPSFNFLHCVKLLIFFSISFAPHSSYYLPFLLFYPTRSLTYKV